MNIKKLGFVSALALMGAISFNTGNTTTLKEQADINGDGRINSLDMAYLQRRIAGYTRNIGKEDRGDLNCDNDVDTLDLSLLQRYVAGFDMTNQTKACGRKLPPTLPMTGAGGTKNEIELIYSPYEISSYVRPKTWKHYKIVQKPDHILTVNLSNLSDDIDLYVTRGNENNTVAKNKKINNNQCIPFEGNKKNELCKLGVTYNSEYIYISIYGVNNGGVFKLSVNEKYSDPNEKAIYPFNLGESWRVCQGYNTKPLTHRKYRYNDLRYSFDLSNYLPSTNIGTYGCSYPNQNNNVTTGKEILSPVNGKITSIIVAGGSKRELICVQDNKTGYSFLLGHMGLDTKGKTNPKWTVGQTISKGSLVGYVAKKSNTGGSYAHIHISLHKKKDCSSNSIPFNSIFEGGKNYSSDESNYQWRKTILSR